MARHHHRHHGNNHIDFSSVDFISLVAPNMEGVYSAIRKKGKAAMVLVLVSFILFIPTFGLTMPLFMIGGILAGINSQKEQKLKQIILLMNEIKYNDKCFIESLTMTRHKGRSSVAMVIRRLIETGNLDGYSLIGDIAVAKTSLGLSERNFTQGSQNIVFHPVSEARSNRCESCGAAKTGGDDKACGFCGTKFH